MRRSKVEETGALSGLILGSGLAILTIGLFTKNLELLWFSVPIIFALIISVSRGNRDIDDAVKSIGVSGSNIKTSLPLGIIAGLATFVFGSFIVSFTDANTASLVPVFAIASVTPSLISAETFLAINIIIQWLIVAPSEELGFRFLAPYVFYSFSKSIPLAMLFGTLLWIVEHIPTFILQGASNSMYIVLLLLGVVSIALIYYTGGILSSWIAHSVFNTLVLLFTGSISLAAYLTMGAIAITLILLYLKVGERNAKTQTNFNL